jgi:hypothetical protein
MMISDFSASYNGANEYRNMHPMCRCMLIETPESEGATEVEVPASFTAAPDAMRIVTDLLLRTKLGEYYKN